MSASEGADKASMTMDDLLSFADEIEEADRRKVPSSNENRVDVGQSWRESIATEDAAAEDEGFNAEEVDMLSSIGQELSDTMCSELNIAGLIDELSDDEHQELMFVIFDKVLKAMKKKGSKQLDEEDRAFVKARMAKEAVTRGLVPPPTVTKRRFAASDHVVCHVGGSRGWAAGTVQALDQEDDEVNPYKTVAYVVKLDPPNSVGFSVAEDTEDHIRAEVCFGRHADSLRWTQYALPRAKARGSTRKRRFAAGERVACAIDAAVANGTTDWAAGTVSSVDHSIEGEQGSQAGDLVPYCVALDCGATVLVHKDEHWLVRDLSLQPIGPRVAVDGTRALTRMGKRKIGDDSWEVIDHATRNVRVQRGLNNQSDGSDGEA